MLYMCYEYIFSPCSDCMVLLCFWFYHSLQLSQLTLWVRTPLRRGVLGTTLCHKVWLATGRWFFPGTPVSSTNENWPPRYNWNIVESDVKHQKPTSHQLNQHEPFLVASLVIASLNRYILIKLWIPSDNINCSITAGVHNRKCLHFLKLL
jgi:hypothetical protein